MGSLVQNNVTFTNLTIGKTLPNKYGNADTADYELTGEAAAFVNAVEIDWNGAELGDKEINTTGELLSH